MEEEGKFSVDELLTAAQESCLCIKGHTSASTEGIQREASIKYNTELE